MGRIKSMDIERLNEQQEAEPTAELTQEQREAVDKAVKAITKALNVISGALIPTIKAMGEAVKTITQTARARLQHQAKVQGLKKKRRHKHRTPQQKKWGKYYLIKTTIKEARLINKRKSKQKPKSSR